MSYLQEDGEEDDGDGGGDEELPAADVVGEGEGQGEGDGPSQATVGEAKLILHVEGDGAERVDDLSQHQDACRRQEVTLFTPNHSNRSASQQTRTSPLLLVPRPLHTKAKSNVNRM